MKPSEFLSILFPATPGYLALWRSDAKSTTWIHSGDWGRADAYAERAKSVPYNSYFGVCLQERDCGAGSRGTAESAVAVPAVWIDLDYSQKPHSGTTPRKKNYPTPEVVKQVLASLPIPPSLILATGGGEHAYWIFDEPFIIKSDEDRTRIAEVVKSWQGLVKSRLLKLGGYGADSTHDLARVMRLPGTPHLSHPGLIVDLDAASPKNLPRYVVSDIERFLHQGRLPTAAAPPATRAPAAVAKPPAKSADKPTPPAAAPVAGDELKLEKIGRRIWFRGKTFAIKDRIKEIGGHWDEKEKAWWIASTKEDSAIAVIGGGALPSKEPDAEPLPVLSPPPATAWEVTANEASEPPGTKLYNLCEADPAFKNLWDKKTVKPSPSEYDMSLANYAINSGWTDQEAAGLLVAFSKRHFPDHLPKLLRVTGGVQDYLKLTITKAHDKRRVENSQREAEAAVDSLAIEVRDALEEGREVNREIVLTKVSEFLGVPVCGFRQTGRRDEVYSLLLSGSNNSIREICVGGAAAIHSSPVKFCERIMAENGTYVPVSKKLKNEWGAIVAGLIAIREFHEVRETDLIERVSDLIVEHLRRFRGGWRVETPEARSEKAKEGHPFIEDDKLHISATALKRLAGEVERGLATGDLFVGLRQLGFSQVTVSLTTAKTSRSYWRGPYEGFQADEPSGSPEAASKPGASAGKAMAAYSGKAKGAE